MKIKSFVSIALTTISIASFSFILDKTSHAHPEESKLSTRDLPTDQISFYCGEITDKKTGESIPATVAYVPQREANVAIIGWKKHWVGWNPQDRCKEVSPKFQTFYDNGRLNYISHGENAGYDIICALLDKDEQCNGDNQLFQVRPSNEPENVVSDLMGNLKGDNFQPIYQNSKDRSYVEIEDILDNAPALK